MAFSKQMFLGTTRIFSGERDKERENARLVTTHLFLYTSDMQNFSILKM